jgi:hypothetical protein
MKADLFAGAVVCAASLSLPASASAQSLSSGDYEQCSVYDRNDRFKGYDSVCLERKRTQLSRLRDRQRSYNPPVRARSAYCPQTSNLGAGYISTWWSNGRVPPYATAYDRPVNGRPCIPNQIYITPGYP